MQHVHRLCQVSHSYSFTMVVKNIQCHAGYHGVANSILLVKKSGISAWFYFIPTSPFIDHQRSFFLRVVFIHEVGMSCHQLFHFKGRLHGGEILLFAKLSCRTFLVPVDNGIVMQGNTLYHIAGNIPHQYFGPVVIISISAGSYTKHFIVIAPIRHERSVLLVDIGVVFGFHIATTSPCLITYSPDFYIPWLFPSILNPPFAHRAGFTIKVYILHPVSQVLDCTASNVSRQVRIGTYYFTHI